MPIAPGPCRPQRPARQQELLEKLYARVGEVSPLPSAAIRLVNACRDDATGAEDVLEIVESDPALAARMLRTVNSSRYAPRYPVSDLKTAIALLGFREIRTLAVTAHASGLFTPSGNYRWYSRAILWNHHVAVASVSRLIAQVCGRVKGDEAYLAGLLHDIGLILIDQHLRKYFMQVLDRLTESASTSDIEQELLLFDHCELGEYVLRQWNLPESIWAAAGYHHTPLEYQGPFHRIVKVVSIANYLSAKRDRTSLGIFNVQAPPQRTFEDLDIDSLKLERILEGLEEIFEFASETAVI